MVDVMLQVSKYATCTHNVMAMMYYKINIMDHIKKPLSELSFVTVMCA